MSSSRSGVTATGVSDVPGAVKQKFGAVRVRTDTVPFIVPPLAAVGLYRGASKSAKWAPASCQRRSPGGRADPFP